MREIPISALLEFPTPNYVDPVTRGSALVVVNGIFIGITLMMLALRIYTRLFIRTWLGADDVLIIIAAIFAVGLTVAVVLADEKYLWNRHVWDIPFTKLAAAGQVAMAAKLLFILASFFTRQSLLCFYYRLVSDSGMHKFRLALHASNLFNLSVCIAFVLLTIFQCTPVKAYWIYPPSGKCLDEGKTTLGAGVINCIADLLITTLPIPMVMRLKMRLRQRLAVTFLLGLGFIVTIAGIVRTYFIWKAFMDSYDETWYSYPLWIAAAVEIDLAVITACAPSLKPLISMYARPLISSISKRSRYGTQEPSADTSRVLEFGPEGRGGSNSKTVEHIQMTQLAESASDLSESPIIIDGPTTEEEKQQHRLNPDDENTRGNFSRTGSLSRSTKSTRSQDRGIHIRKSIETLQPTAPLSPLAIHPSSKMPSRTPANVDRGRESPFADGRGSPVTAAAASSRRVEPGYDIQGKKSEERTWPLREELVSRYASASGGVKHSPDGSWENNVQFGAHATRAADDEERRRVEAAQQHMNTAWLGDRSSSSADEGETGTAR